MIGLENNEPQIMNRITFMNNAVCENNKNHDVSFDMTVDDNITRMVVEFRLFLLGMGYHPDTVNEFVPYCDLDIDCVCNIEKDDFNDI